jgi:hypothetical protein
VTGELCQTLSFVLTGGLLRLNQMRFLLAMGHQNLLKDEVNCIVICE